MCMLAHVCVSARGVTVKVFKYCISIALDGTDDMLWMLGMGVRKMKALTVEMETVTLTGKVR